MVGTFAPAPDASALEELRLAMREQRRLRIRYVDGQGRRSLREIRPFRIYRSRYGATYVEAFCYLKNESRTFRADRIESIEPAASGPTGPLRPASTRPAPAAPVEPPPPTSPTSPRPRHDGGGLRAFLGIAAAIAVIVLIARGGKSRAESDAALSTPAAEALRAVLSQPAGSSRQAYASRPAGMQSPSPVALIRTLPHRGYAIRDERTLSGERYTVAALGISAPDLRSAYLAVDAALFERRTGITDARLEAIYGAADTDRNGHLSWQEVMSFQLAVYHIFSYEENKTALRPDQFLDERGGDCEDWALFTAGLLHFWGWNAEIALFSRPKGGSGHAAVFVRVPGPIAGIGSYAVAAGGQSTSRGIVPGTYVPIDYWSVGGLTNAVGKGWRLEALRYPESLYGKVM